MKSEKKKKSENTIKEGHFQALIENAHDAIVVYDATGRIKYASKSLKKILGFNVREVIGKFGTHFVHPDDGRTDKHVILFTPQATSQAVEKLNGKISLNSKYGAGTKIKINLPNEKLTRQL
jgi:PAS domain S-box-containing protein